MGAETTSWASPELLTAAPDDDVRLIRQAAVPDQHQRHHLNLLGPFYVDDGCRIHFRDKVESAFAVADYARIELLKRHPLLLNYLAPCRSLFFYGRPANPRKATAILEREIRSDTDSWRGLRDYHLSIDSAKHLLSAGHGKLIDAPDSVCTAAARLLEGLGIQCSIVGGSHRFRGERLLLLGRSYVVAGGFAFEPLASPGTRP